MDMRGPLVDVEGYPLSDVDLYQVRTARHHISRLQNDHKAIMLEIEEALHRLHARERARRDRDDAGDLALCPAFAKVDTVAEGSPASQSGLRVGDEIIEFGSVNSRNFQNLQNIATVVQHSEGKPLTIVVVRSGQKVHLSLTPQRWSGRGLLGCNVVPLQR